MKIIVSVSGGKDSTACLIKALNECEKQNVFPVFADTRWEHPLTYQYLEYLEDKLDIKITRVHSKKYDGLLDIIKKKRIFPSSRRRFCTQYLKQEPVHKWIAENFDVENTQFWLGIRTDESSSRANKYGNLSETELYNFIDINPYVRKKIAKLKVRFPVLKHTANDVYRIITEAGLDVNPLYHKGFDRVGCFPCVISSLKEFKRVWRDKEGRENILKLIELEKELNNLGYATTIKPDKNGQQILQMLTNQDKQSNLFEEEEIAMCGFCHY